MTTVPYVGTDALRRAALVTRVVRIGLAAAVAGLVLAAAASARSAGVSEPPLLPPQAGGVVVLDLSASITTDTYSRIEETLRQLVARGGRYGLVVFSDDAYEALPPGSPASALAPLIRYFTLPRASGGEQPSFPINPWTASFTDGTSISSGLALAESVERAAGIAHPQILLISDLADDQTDVQRLIALLGRFRATHVALRVIALNAAPNDAAFFAGMIGNAAAVSPAGLAPAQAGALPAPTAAFPTLLVALAAAAALLLAASELYGARLRFALRSAEGAP